MPKYSVQYKVPTSPPMKSQVLEADGYKAVGDFIEFTSIQNGNEVTVWACRAEAVVTIARAPE